MAGVLVGWYEDHVSDLSSIASPDRRYRILLVTSSGGVLLDLLGLCPWWSRHDPVWAAVPAADTEAVLAGQRVHWMRERVAARPLGLVAATWTAWRILGHDRPDLLVSAGTGVAIGFFLAARLRGVPALWLETLNLVKEPGLTSRVCSRLAARVLVQRPEQLSFRPGAVVLGDLY
jgi:hypothetical protein